LWIKQIRYIHPFTGYNFARNHHPIPFHHRWNFFVLYYAYLCRKLVNLVPSNFHYVSLVAARLLLSLWGLVVREGTILKIFDLGGIGETRRCLYQWRCVASCHLISSRSEGKSVSQSIRILMIDTALSAGEHVGKVTSVLFVRVKRRIYGDTPRFNHELNLSRLRS